MPGVDCLWFDEVDKMKSPTSLRFRGRGRKNTKSWVQGMRHWREHYPLLVGMTGTPVSNGLLDLWAQLYCVDGGERLGKTFEQYQRTYFYQSDWSGYKWKVYPDAVDTIYGRIADGVFRIEASADAAPVVYSPPRYVDLQPDVRKQYKSMEREYVMEFADADPTVAISAATAYSKLRQVVAGFVYTEVEGAREVHTLHDEKLKELDSLLSELNGAQLMVVYQFKEQAAQLKRRYGKRVACLDADASTKVGSRTIQQWNGGELPILGIQPQSAGHGLNLQLSGAHHMCMLTEPESAGLYNQVVGRLARTGQVHTVFVHTIHARGTIDEDRAKVVTSKRDTLRATLDAIKERQGEDTMTSRGPSDHLTWDEMACHDERKTPYPEDLREDRGVQLAGLFELMRYALGDAPLRILSAYRSPDHNRKVGGARKSQHVQGRAIDIATPAGVSYEKFHARVHDITKHRKLASVAIDVGGYSRIFTLAYTLGAVGYYPWGVHLDTRPRTNRRLVAWSAKTVENVG